jgi:flagellar protein FlbD
MIMLTRINGQTMAVNSDLIKLIEASHDTVITLLTGEKVVVLENTEEVISRIINFRRAILSSDRLGASLPQPSVSSRYIASRLGSNSEDE